MLNMRMFEQKLQGILSNVLDAAEALQSTAEDPVVLDQAWILDRMKNLMVVDNFVLEPRAMQIRQGLGDLHKLPRELRNIVYSHAIADGNMAIMRASQQTYKEASSLVFPKGIYRLLIKFPNQVTNIQPDSSIANKIQNVHVRVNARGFVKRSADGLAILRNLQSDFIIRKNCVVTIESCLFSTDMSAVGVVDALTGFNNFERVILELDLDWWGEPWPDTMEDFVKDQIWGRISAAFHFQKKMLEPTLGTGEFSSDVEQSRLAFHPRQQRLLRCVEGLSLESQDNGL
ncbi:MAG: hypothetical protein Q9175_005453 [Cornicularia normoerica]